MTFYNTIDESNDTLAQSQVKALDQETKTLMYYFNNQGMNATPSEVWKTVFNERIPITSVRRAITTLTIKGRLEKLTIKRGGIYGKEEHSWQYKEPEDKQEGLFNG